MSCPSTKRIDGSNWPLFQGSSTTQCCYVVDVATRTKAASVAQAAKSMTGYIKRSRFYDMPGNRIRFYVYFRA